MDEEIATHFPTELDPHDEDFAAYPHWLDVEEAQELADTYTVEKDTMADSAESAGISLEAFKHFRRAHTLRKGKAAIVDPEESVSGATEHFSEEMKRREVDRKARRRHKRERDQAARRWWRVESAITEALEELQAGSYDPPKPKLKLSSYPDEDGAVLINGQDWHVGKRPAEAQEGYHSRYVDAVKDAFAGGLEKAMRMRRIEQLYLVTGGDLIHVDGPDGTTSGTPQDLLMSPGEAFKEAVELLRWCIDYARSLGAEVHVLTIMGNHDRTLSSAAGVAVQQRFHNADDVVSYPLQERVYATYEDTLILATHGDLKKRQWKKLPSIMMGEARQKLAETEWQTVVSGHLHFQSVDVEDQSGTLFAQGSSPSPTDAWHYQEGYSTSRRGLQLLVMEPHGPSTSIVQESVSV